MMVDNSDAMRKITKATTSYQVPERVTGNTRKLEITARRIDGIVNKISYHEIGKRDKPKE